MTARFAVADELTCYYDSPAEPANVHLEVWAAGTLDREAFGRAVHAVLAAEPALRARRSASGGWRSGFSWEYPPGLDGDPVQVAGWADETELSRLRAAFLSRSPSVDRSPPFAFLLACGPGTDVVILNAHHARVDGLACVRLMRRVADAYEHGGGDARARGTTPEPAGDGARPGAAQPRPRGKAAASVRSLRSARIAGDPGPRPFAGGRLARRPAAPGYGAVLRTWEGLEAARSLRRGGWSVNDLLITAMMITVARWNEAHGSDTGLVRVTMPVGQREPALVGEQWANNSRLTTVSVRPRRHDATASLLACVAEQASRAKREPRPQVGALSRALASVPVPVAVKRRVLRSALAAAGSVLCDTTLISNLGILEPMRFGAAAVTQAWFSTAAHMPRGLSLGVITSGDRLALTFRYRRALLSDAGAEAFAKEYAACLDRVIADVGGSP